MVMPGIPETMLLQIVSMGGAGCYGDGKFETDWTDVKIMGDETTTVYIL